MNARHALFTAFTASALLVLIASSTSQTPGTALQISPVSIDFGEAALNADGPAHTVTVSNPSKSPIDLQQILTSGIDFSQKNDCGKLLAPGAQCTVQVSFAPAISGPRTGNLQIMGSDGAPHFIALNGIGK